MKARVRSMSVPGTLNLPGFAPGSCPAPAPSSWAIQPPSSPLKPPRTAWLSKHLAADGGPASRGAKSPTKAVRLSRGLCLGTSMPTQLHQAVVPGAFDHSAMDEATWTSCKTTGFSGFDRQTTCGSDGGGSVASDSSSLFEWLGEDDESRIFTFDEEGLEAGTTPVDRAPDLNDLFRLEVS
mmetsp:Transcript_85363/g.133375  ORF Transcript_85363/g.133375 Transcript_85363/m.133375 type:complete len:181 (+) Transcript_85363:92-634(+)